MASKTLLVVAHSPSPNTERLRAAIVAGVNTAELRDLRLVVKTPFEAQAPDVLSSDAVILGTTENLGYMSGALQDFFDRVYNPCLEQTRAMPYAAYIRAGHGHHSGHYFNHFRPRMASRSATFNP